MWGTDNWTGNCVTMNVLSAWNGQISAMSCRKTFRNYPRFTSIDVSFISLTKVLLPVRNLLTEDGEVVCLIKPQFEAGRVKSRAKRVW